MIKDIVISDLMKIGLQKNEAKAYQTLVRLGKSTATKIAEKAEMPRSKVYSVLASLERKGIINKICGTNPAQFLAYSPGFAIPLLLEKIEAAGNTAQRMLERLEQERDMEIEEQVMILEGVEQIKVCLRREISLAGEEILIATQDFDLLRMLRPAFAKARAIGVPITLLTPKIDDQLNSEFQQYLTIQDLSGVSSKVLVDRMKIVLNDDRLDVAGWDPSQISVIVIDNSQSIAIFKSQSDQRRPWAMQIRNPMIVIFQLQVIMALLASIQEIIGH